MGQTAGTARLIDEAPRPIPERGSSRLRRDRTALVLIAVGAGTRLALMGALWRTPLDPDGREYVSLARGFSFLRPWAASPREPVWVGFVKLVTGPFGYSSQALRVAGVLLGTACLVAVWALLSRVASRRVALISLGILALNPQLVYDAARGLREPVTFLLMIPVCACLLRATPSADLSPLRRVAPVSLAVLPLVRWELFLLALVLLVAAMLWNALPWRAVVAGLGASLVLMVPWLVANQQHYGDALYHSNRGAMYIRNHDIAYLGAEGEPPTGAFSGPHITWGEYYLHFVGPEKAARRQVSGTVDNVRLMLSATLNPPWPRWPTGEPAAALRMTSALLELGAVLLAALAVALARRRQAWNVRVAVLVVLVDAAAYGAVSRWVEYRLLSWGLPLLAIVVATGAVLALDGWRNRSRQLGEPATR